MRWSREVTPELLAHIRQRYEETDEPVKSIAAECEVRERRIYEWAVQYGWRRRRQRPPLDLPPGLRLSRDVDRALEEAEEQGRALPHGPQGDATGTAPTLPLAGRVGEHCASDASPGGGQEHGRCDSHPHPAAFGGGPPRKGEGDSGEAPAPPSALTVAERLERQLEQTLARVERMREMQWPQGPADAERTTRVLERLTAALLKVRQLRNPGTARTDATADTHDFDVPTDIDEFRRALARRIESFVRSRADAGLRGAGDACGADRA